MYILKWKCRYNSWSGQFPPAPKWIAQAIQAHLSNIFPDYMYWLVADFVGEQARDGRQ